MDAKELFDNLKKEMFLLWSQNKNLSEFVKLPEKLTYNKIPNKKFQSLNILENSEVDDNSIKSIHKLIKKSHLMPIGDKIMKRKMSVKAF